MPLTGFLEGCGQRRSRLGKIDACDICVAGYEPPRIDITPVLYGLRNLHHLHLLRVGGRIVLKIEHSADKDQQTEQNDPAPRACRPVAV